MHVHSSVDMLLAITDMKIDNLVCLMLYYVYAGD